MGGKSQSTPASTREQTAKPAHQGLSPSSAAPSPVPALRPRRSPRLVIIGLLMACLGALGAAMAWSQATTAEPVVVMVNDVARGEVVQSSDLGIATLGTPPGVKALPADRIPDLVGKQALVDLQAGSLVGDRAIGQATTQKGQSELGLKLAAGRLPTSELPAGTTVLLVPVAAKDSPAPSTAGIAATVVSKPSALPDGSTWVLDVSVADQHAATVAQLAASESLVVVKRGSR